MYGEAMNTTPTPISAPDAVQASAPAVVPASDATLAGTHIAGRESAGAADAPSAPAAPPELRPAPGGPSAGAAAELPDTGHGPVALSPLAQRFVLHWGEMGTRWGVNRTVAQIHALLYYLGRPMNADELVATLGVARSNVSTSLRELQAWRLARVVHVMGDRRDHFETSGDVWELLRTVVAERKRREFDPTAALLRESVADPAFAQEPAAAQQRIRDTLALTESVAAWADEMLRLDPATLQKVLKLLSTVQKLVRNQS
jgi:DNA-binding transcriptional regulator GbsR (MarR family)